MEAPNSVVPALEIELNLLRGAFRRLGANFASLAPSVATAPEPSAAMDSILLEVADRLADNYPYFHPLYAGQMLKPPHPIARLAYQLAISINPNNHALDGGRASSLMEKEAVADLARMFGWETHLGHLCSGGTLANLEALWVAGQLHPGMTILASTQAHYIHARLSKVLGLPFETIPCDQLGRINRDALRTRLQAGGVGMVVATIGTTATGSVDPLPWLLDLRKEQGFRLHADAAYGGYFTLVNGLRPDTAEAFACLGEVDSLVIDPHKHGLQPYGCGCVLFRDPSVGCFYKHDSPYTYFSSPDLHLGEISLECSRPGAAAVALWATMRLLPLTRGGEFAQLLSRSHSAAVALHQRLRQDARFLTALEPELDIVIWAVRAQKSSEVSHRTRQVFADAGRLGVHFALAQVPTAFFDLARDGLEVDSATITCLRSVLMKPEHGEWLDQIWAGLDQATQDVIARSSAGV